MWGKLILPDWDWGQVPWDCLQTEKVACLQWVPAEVVGTSYRPSWESGDDVDGSWGLETSRSWHSAKDPNWVLACDENWVEKARSQIHEVLHLGHEIQACPLAHGDPRAAFGEVHLDREGHQDHPTYPWGHAETWLDHAAHEDLVHVVLSRHSLLTVHSCQIEDFPGLAMYALEDR